MMTYYAAFLRPGSLWNPDKTAREQPFWDEHARFMDALFEKGLIILGGPFADRTGSLVIVAADSAAQVYEMYRSDPWTEQERQLLLDTRHVATRLGMRNRVGGEGKRSSVFHLARSAYKGSKGCPGESTTHADPLDSGGSQLCDGKGGALQAHQDVDWPGNRRTNLSDHFKARQAGAYKTSAPASANACNRLYGVVEIGAAMKEVLGSRSQHELTIVSRLCRRGDPLHRELELIDRIVRDRLSHPRSIPRPGRSPPRVEWFPRRFQACGRTRSGDQPTRANG